MRLSLNLYLKKLERPETNGRKADLEDVYNFKAMNTCQFGEKLCDQDSHLKS